MAINNKPNANRGMTFADFARAQGLIPPPVIEPGRTIRVPTIGHERKRNGLLRLDEDGRAGIAINYESGESVAQWKANGERAEIDHAKANAELSARLAKRREKEKAGTARALAEYNAATELVGAAHPYIAAKMLTMDACRGLKINAKGELIVPMFRRSKLVTLQRISAEGEKKFATGAPSKGAFFEISRPRYSMTILCEGFATGATLFSACPMARVIVCFSAENLVTVAEQGEWRGMVVIASDHDWDSLCQRHFKEGEHIVHDPDFPRPEWCRCNPGKTAARKAEKIIGCGSAIPQGDGTDFNDVFCHHFARLEKAEESKPWKTSPHKLRASALSFVAPSMMRNAKMFVEK